MKMIKIKNIIQSSIDVKTKILNDDQRLQNIFVSSEVITTALRTGNRIYFCGNGGSAADAQHLAAEFSGRFYIDRKALPAEALHCNTSYLTAVGNDYGYDNVYSRIIDGIANKGDVLIGLSTSGNSNNIVRAFEVARKKQVITIGLTGVKPAKIHNFSHILIDVPSDDTPRVQESHIMIGHIICQLVEENLFS